MSREEAKNAKVLNSNQTPSRSSLLREKSASEDREEWLWWGFATSEWATSNAARRGRLALPALPRHRLRDHWCREVSRCFYDHQRLARLDGAAFDARDFDHLARSRAEDGYLHLHRF